MRFADFIVDLAAVAAASRSVASKHAALRARQLDAYTRSSQALKPTGRQPLTRSPAAGSSDSSAPADTGVDAAQFTPEAGRATTAADGGNGDAPASTGIGRDAFPQEAEALGPTGDSGEQHTLAAKTASSRLSKATDVPRPSAGFRPAPWASLSGNSPSAVLKPQPRTPAGHPPASETKEGGVDNGSMSQEIDLNVFRTARASRTLGSHNIRPEDIDGTSARQISEASDLSTATGVGGSEKNEKSESSMGDAAVYESVIPTGEDKPLEITSEKDQTTVDSTSPDVTPGGADSRLSREDQDLVKNITSDAAPGPITANPYRLRESKVPATRLSRLWNYSGLAVGMFAGAIGEGISRAAGGGGAGSVMLSAGNMERLVAKLSRMRGAALKLGQMMSFQDSKMLPAPIQEVLQRVQDRADYMPAWQRDKVLVSNLGEGWRDLFGDFEETPMAAASIGQVHRATLKSNGAKVAVKIQFPGVANSINSDLDNLAMLLAATRLLPKGLYLNKTIDNARTELAWECDYVREAECAERYRTLLADETDTFVVPRIYSEASGREVIAMEYMEGVTVTRVTSFTQAQRDWIGTQILRLCLREITEFRFMQTDPNWTNFLYNATTGRLELLDFGASREFPPRFIGTYVRLLEAASRSDRGAVRDLSQELGYLTGHESRAMLDAHVDSVLTLAEPFTDAAPEVYDFRDQTITERVKALIPTMIRERLAPPPEETYSLHRKLSGAFLLCARLGSQVRCREMFQASLKKSATAHPQ